jgi:hypothetical protein
MCTQIRSEAAILMAGNCAANDEELPRLTLSYIDKLLNASLNFADINCDHAAWARKNQLTGLSYLATSGLMNNLYNTLGISSCV